MCIRDRFLTLVELVGTVAFSVSGAATAIGKRMDIFGVCILGIITAVGGGIIRDLMIGSTPPQCFQSPLYLVVACLAAAVFFLPFIRKPLQRRQAGFDLSLIHILPPSHLPCSFLQFSPLDCSKGHRQIL